MTFAGGGLAYADVAALSSTSPFVAVNVTQQGIGAAAGMFSGAIAIDPANANIIYLGTGTSQGENRQDSSYGTGVYESINGGQTWNLVEDANNIGGPQNPLSGLAVNKILVDPTDTNIIYVATTDVTSNGAPGQGISDEPTQDQAGVWRFGIVNEVQCRLPLPTLGRGGRFPIGLSTVFSRSPLSTQALPRPMPATS